MIWTYYVVVNDKGRILWWSTSPMLAYQYLHSHDDASDVRVESANPEA